MDKKALKAYKKMSPEEVQGLMVMRRKGGAIKAKKGKGSYNRKNFKKEVVQNDGLERKNVDCDAGYERSL